MAIPFLAVWNLASCSRHEALRMTQVDQSWVLFEQQAFNATVLGDIHVHFTWQAWHKLTSTVVLRGRRGTYGTGWRAWSGFVACDAAALCVAGVALGDIYVRFTWQAWHNLTSTFVLRGRRGTIFDTPSFTHHFVTHHLSHTTLSHTTLSHTLFHTPLCHHTIFHTQLCHTLSLTHHLSHTTLSHTIFDTPSFTHHLCNTPSFTHHLSPHHLSHTTLSHTIFHTQLCHTLSFTHNFHTHTPFFTHCFVTHLHTIFLRHIPSFTLDFVTHNCFNFSILHHLLCLSFLLRPCYNLSRSLLEEVALWGYPVL